MHLTSLSINIKHLKQIHTYYTISSILCQLKIQQNTTLPILFKFLLHLLKKYSYFNENSLLKCIFARWYNLSQYIFKRYEKKYILNKFQYKDALNMLTFNTVADKHGESDICNIYFDTPDFRIIRKSIEKPVYKEKLRLRCYGVPQNDSKCFLEIKKKYKGIVYKRRICAEYEDGYNYLNNICDNVPDSQIKNEIEYFKRFYEEQIAKANIFYHRIAFYDKDDINIRITFDTDIKYRFYELDLKNGIYGKALLPENTYIMEIKTLGAIPLWLTKMLDELKIYPTPFSKYGNSYKQFIGGINYDR